ncbi:MAG: SCO family protein [Gemmatimonadetes bacterium]|nr:SCO family protein [Gemmatimonadota bacterium]
MNGLPPSATRFRLSFRTVLGSVALSAAVLAAVVASLQPGLLGSSRAFHGTVYEDPEPAPAFSLTDHHGEPARLEDFRGRATLLFFGFTHCPDVCPLTLQRLARAADALGRRGKDVEIVLITVDPERDTPEVLAEYMERFGPRVTGLTGDAVTLEGLRREYGVYAAPHAGHGDSQPTIVHTPAVFGIDRAGRLRVLMHADGPEEALQSDLRSLLAL